MKLRHLLAVAPVAALLAAAPADAEILTVTRLDDPAGGTCAPGSCSLRQAVRAANVNGDAANVIRLAAGVHSLEQVGDDDTADAGDLDVRKDLTIEGAGMLQSTIRGVPTVSRTAQTRAITADRVLHVGAGDTAAALTLRDVQVSGGRTTTEDGGGIFVGPDAALTLERVTVAGNEASGVSRDGGGIAAFGAVTVRDSLIMENKAGDDGGGIAMRGSDPLTMTRSAVLMNVASDASSGGDGAAVYGLAGGVPVSISASTIADNEVRGPSGLAAVSTNGPTTIFDSTIVDNASGAAGQVAGVEGNAVQLRNSVVARNRSADGEGPVVNCAGSVGSLGHTFEDAATCTLLAVGDLPNAGDPRLTTNPLLAGDRAVPTDAELRALVTRRPLDGSPVIDTGGGCSAIDQLGGRRPQGRGCEIGAVELAVPAAAPPVVPAPPAAGPAPAAAAPASPGTGPAARPAIRKLSAKSRRGRTTLRVELDRAARLTATIATRPRRGKRRTVATLRKAGRKGVNTLTRRLRPGRYEATVRAAAGGMTSPTRRVTFTVPR